MDDTQLYLLIASVLMAASAAVSAYSSRKSALILESKVFMIGRLESHIKTLEHNVDNTYRLYAEMDKRCVRERLNQQQVNIGVSQVMTVLNKKSDLHRRELDRLNPHKTAKRPKPQTANLKVKQILPEESNAYGPIVGGAND